MTVLLGDGDVFVYRCGFGAQKVIDGEVVAEPVENALNGMKQLIKRLLNETRCSTYKIFLSTNNDINLFRNSIAVTKPYKGNRKDFKKPIHYNSIREYLLKYYNTDLVSSIEADDALGIHQSKNSIICSYDKDLLQVPGRHYNFVKKLFIDVDEFGGWRNYYSQVLTGDIVDNIPGLFRIGPKKAAYILRDCRNEKEMWEACIKAYKLYSNRDDYMAYLYEQAELLYILRKVNDKWKPPI